MSDQQSGDKYPSADELVSGLVKLLDVQAIGANTYLGLRKPGGVGRVYGGQVIAQALMAALKTVDESLPVHSLHAYFLRGGNEDYEIEYRVEADFNGRSFSNRRVIALQQGEVILNLAASFHKVEPGHAHQPVMPDVPEPESLENVRDYVLRNPEKVAERFRSVYLRPSPIEMRPIGEPPFGMNESREPHSAFWFRIRRQLDLPQAFHRTIVAYASDIALISTAMRPHGNFMVKGASLDHSIWFHDDAQADDWLLYSIDSPWSGGARGLGIGKIFDRSGRLVATVAQEGLMRDPALSSR